MASSKKAHAEDAPREQSARAKNVGPAGFALFEYLGENRDHTSIWFHVKRNLRNYVITNYDTLIEQIIEKGTRPIVPEVDLEELMLSAPSEFKKVSVMRDEESEQEESIQFGEDLSDATAKGSTKKATFTKSKPKSSSSMSQTREENPMYRYEMILFEDKVKETGKIRIKLANLIET